jgi:hypothetical protein
MYIVWHVYSCPMQEKTCVIVDNLGVQFLHKSYHWNLTLSNLFIINRISKTFKNCLIFLSEPYTDNQIKLHCTFWGSKMIHNKKNIVRCFENKKSVCLPLVQTFHQTSHWGHGECFLLTKIAYFWKLKTKHLGCVVAWKQKLVEHGMVHNYLSDPLPGTQLKVMSWNAV